MAAQIQNLEPERVHAWLHSRPEGLRDAEVAERRHEVGPNTLQTRRRLWWLASLVRQFVNFFTILLLVAAAFCFVADAIQPGESMALLGGALLGVAVLNALFSFVQEFRAERAMDELRKFLPQKVMVRREGTDVEALADDIVPGDVLVVREGDKVPADARLVLCQELLVNNAPLTGESSAVTLTAEALTVSLVQATNLVFAGCTVLKGSGEAVVFATGHRTEFGKIATLSHDVQRVVSPLEHETQHMVRVLTIIAVAMALAFFVAGVFLGRSLWVNLVFMMGIIVANVPEGLPATLTLSLAMGSLRMARRNVLVKGLTAVEALGAVHVICTDKTGTLTQNRLAVMRLAAPLDGAEMETPGPGTALLKWALIASDLHHGGTGYRGDPLDVAVAERFERVAGDAQAVLARSLRRFPFVAERRRSAGLARDGDGVVIAVKGAWEALRPLITAIEDGGGTRPVDAEELVRADAVIHRLGTRGQRVIAVAYRTLKAEPEADAHLEALEPGLTLAGFLGLEDPIRPEVPDAIAKCRAAGIEVMMITGDHPDTAEAVARQIGLLAEHAAPGSRTVTGVELARLRHDDLKARLAAGAVIFARTTPEQKMKIVTALHDLELVVAVTGDGVNDAPALKAADVGVAMGRSGTDVARETAQVILLDDNFASIVAGVEEGRTIFANIRKFTNYVLVHNGPEIVAFLIYIVLPVPLALTVIQILSIDLGTEIVPSMGLGREPPHQHVMRARPRGRHEGLLTWPLIAHSYLFLGLIEAVFSLTLFFWVLIQGGWTYGKELAAADPLYRSATGITLASIILMQIGNLAGRRDPEGSGLDSGLWRNPLLVAGVGLEIVFSWAILYAPPVSAAMGTGPVAPEVYATAWLGMPLIYGLDYARKWIAWRRRVAEAVTAGNGRSRR